MTQISPRHRRDMAIHFARLHRTRDMDQMRRSIVEMTCAVGLVILAASAGYLAHAPETCAEAVAWVVNED
jgi:hypothetical protein